MHLPLTYDINTASKEDYIREQAITIELVSLGVEYRRAARGCWGSRPLPFSGNEQNYPFNSVSGQAVQPAPLASLKLSMAV